LWGMERTELLRTFMAAGFEAIVVAVRNDIMDDHWLGRRVDGAFVEQMEERGIDVCGENGEYHTLVVDGPIFGKRIEIGEARITRRGTMAFLQVLDYSLEDKR
jgi:diphthine-ammonia ligase